MTSDAGNKLYENLIWQAELYLRKKMH